MAGIVHHARSRELISPVGRLQFNAGAEPSLARWCASWLVAMTPASGGYATMPLTTVGDVCRQILIHFRSPAASTILAAPSPAI